MRILLSLAVLLGMGCANPYIVGLRQSDLDRRDRYQYYQGQLNCQEAHRNQSEDGRARQAKCLALDDVYFDREPRRP